MYLISIHKSYADEIFEGSKKWEYRNAPIRAIQPGETLFVHVPRIGIIGYFDVSEISRTSKIPTGLESYAHRGYLYMIGISNPRRVRAPIEIKHLTSIPQRFKALTPEIEEYILDRI